MLGVSVHITRLLDFANYQYYVDIEDYACEVKYVPFNINLLNLISEVLAGNGDRVFYKGKKSPYNLGSVFNLFVLDLAQYETPFPTLYNFYTDPVSGDVEFI
mmetsp:Transcript_32280/g.23830  ORF Transcript_32280/g.23830 Transcript_32280/m.23830 type:complete len:102 (-) Transcript_32280:143-448(-)